MSQEISSVFDVNVIGTESGNPYTGTFKVRTLLTQRQLAVADEVRRDIIGPNPLGVLPSVATNAFVSGQLSVRVLESPDWFKNGGVGGIDLPDFNVTQEVFAQAIKAEEARKKALGLAADKAADSMKKKMEK